MPAFVAFSIVPVGGTITVGGYTTLLQLADPPWGILLLLMCSSVSVYGVMLAGWASGSKYPLIGAVRASAQMISYEAALGLTVATVVLVTGSLLTPRHRRRAARRVPLPLEHLPHLRRPCGHLLHRHHRRDDPPAL